MVPRIKILMSFGSKKGTQIHYLFLSETPGKQIPSRFPSGAPMERDTHLEGIFTSLLIYLFLSFPRVPGLFTHSFIHVCLLESPKRSLPTYGEKHKVTLNRAPSRQKAYIQWCAAWCYYVYFVHVWLFKDVVNSSDLQ